jgi:hypothetical protein
MTTETAKAPVLAPRYERFTATYPSGTVVMSFYAGGAPLEEARMTHPVVVVALWNALCRGRRRGAGTIRHAARGSIADCGRGAGGGVPAEMGPRCGWPLRWKASKPTAHLRLGVRQPHRPRRSTPLVPHLRAHPQDIQVLLVVRAAVDLQHVDVVGHEADVGVWIPVQPRR